MADKNMEAQISVEFNEATSRQSLNSGETTNTLWGKVKRWLSDLKAVAFSGSYNDLSDAPSTATTETDGLMSAADKTKLDGADDKYALKSKYGDTTINVGRKAGTTVGKNSTAEGYSTTASEYTSHAEGDATTSSGFGSHAEGRFTVASGEASHAEGYNTVASGFDSHAEGYSTNNVTQLIENFSSSTSADDIINAWKDKLFTLAHNGCSHAEGQNCLALSSASHAEGNRTIAKGIYSHAEGDYTVASGSSSHAGGYGTKALHSNEVAYGTYNISNDNTLFSIGDGTSDTARHNAFEITKTGGKLHDKDIATTDIIPDLSEYAKKADVPNIKVNEAVNADTLGGIQAVDFRQITNIRINTLPTPPSSEGDYFVSQGDSSFPYTYGNLSIRYGSYTEEFVAIYQTTGDDQNIWFNVYRGGWTGWRRINDGGNADTVDGLHVSCTNDAVAGSSWFAAFSLDGNNLRAIDPARAVVGNATNADTLDGLHSDSFALKTDLDSVFKHYGLKGVADISPDTRGCFTVNIIDSFTGWLNVIQFEDGHFITQIGTYANAGITTGGWIRTRYANNPFGDWNTGWVRLCQAKSAAFSGTTSSNGLLALWDTNTFRRVPMYIEANNYRATPLLVNGVCYAQFIDPNTNSIVSNTQVSCTVYWTDL